MIGRQAKTLLSQTIRAMAHVIVVALLVAFGFATWNTVYEFTLRPDLWAAGHPAARWVGAAIVSLPFILIALVTIGLPASALLARLSWETPIVYAVAGAIGGLAFWPLFEIILSGGRPHDTFGMRNAMPETVVFGAIAAYLWWQIARRRAR